MKRHHQNSIENSMAEIRHDPATIVWSTCV